MPTEVEVVGEGRADVGGRECEVQVQRSTMYPVGASVLQALLFPKYDTDE